MKISIEGKLFDTAKAKHQYSLDYVDQRGNEVTGELYCTVKGEWYVYTPSQWGNMHHWEYLGHGSEGAKTALQQYIDLLEEEEVDEIANEFGIEFD